MCGEIDEISQKILSVDAVMQHKKAYSFFSPSPLERQHVITRVQRLFSYELGVVMTPLLVSTIVTRGERDSADRRGFTRQIPRLGTASAIDSLPKDIDVFFCLEPWTEQAIGTRLQRALGTASGPG